MKPSLMFNTFFLLVSFTIMLAYEPFDAFTCVMFIVGANILMLLLVLLLPVILLVPLNVALSVYVFFYFFVGNL